MNLNSISDTKKLAREMRMVDEILKEKRKEIDRDIAAFIAQKENEYTEFEKLLWTHDEKSGGRGNLRDLNIAKYTEKVGESTESHEAPSNGDKPHGFSLSPTVTNVSLRSFPHKLAESFVPIDPGSPGNLGASEGTPTHEREAEFQGLFTPSFLPLLDSSIRDHAHSPSKPPKSVDNQTISEAKSSSVQTSPSHLASSMTRPVYTASSSAPPDTYHASLTNTSQRGSPIRRSSSRSDMSIASPRSSLRDPKHPRSSKRVLFSIDNVVVSPSTAPAKQQSDIIPQVHSFDLDNIPQGFENIAAGTIKPEIGTREGTVTSKSKKYKVDSAPAEGTMLYKSRPFRRSSNLKGGIPIMPNDDFEALDYEDDLFTFDEDIGIGELEHADKINGSSGSDEEDEERKDIDVSGSPHAGSLPIEIKWPVKQDPRK